MTCRHGLCDQGLSTFCEEYLNFAFKWMDLSGVISPAIKTTKHGKTAQINILPEHGSHQNAAACATTSGSCAMAEVLCLVLVLALLCRGVWFLVYITRCEGLNLHDLRSSHTYHSSCKCTYRSHKKRACLLLEALCWFNGWMNFARVVKKSSGL